jgi:hypothetical protein
LAAAGRGRERKDDREQEAREDREEEQAALAHVGPY